MRGATIFYLDGKNITFNEDNTTNFVELVRWLGGNENAPFVAITSNRQFILYKHAIRSVDLY